MDIDGSRVTSSSSDKSSEGMEEWPLFVFKTDECDIVENRENVMVEGPGEASVF